MSARSIRRGMFVVAGVLLLLIVLFDFLDNPKHAEKNMGVNLLFIVGGISIIFFNKRK